MPTVTPIDKASHIWVHSSSAATAFPHPIRAASVVPAVLAGAHGSGPDPAREGADEQLRGR